MAGVWGSENDPRLGGEVKDPGYVVPQPGTAVPPPAPGVAAGPPPGLVAGPPPGAGYPTPPAAPAQMNIGGGPQGGGSFAGQRTVGAEAGPADYQGVQGFADQAYQQARRNIDPMQAQASRRMEQDLINKGIDPMSEQGMAMLDQQNRNFADQNNSATFGALQFGQGIQNQMFNQAFQNTAQAGQMQQAQWQNQTAQRGQDVQKYGMDQNFNIQSGQLDMARQGQDFNQMMGLEGVDFRNRAYNDKQAQYYDQLTMAMMGIPIPGYGGYDPTGLASAQMAASGGGGFFG
jgi:hypothetical protein